MNKAKVFINGKFFDPQNAKISVFDRAFMYGDGCFETMRSYTGVIFRLDDHLNRLFSSLKALKIAHSYSKRYLKKALYKSLKVNGLSSAYIKLTITRGEGRFGISHKDDFTPNLVIVSKDFEGYPGWMFSRGISVKITGTQNERNALSKIKSLNYLPYIMARFDAQKAGFDDAVLINMRGYITEAATSNIFAVKGKVIFTPSVDSGILPGVTRGVVIESVKRMKLKVRQIVLSRAQLVAADEIFLTNTMAEILPVTKIDSKKVGDGRIGELTKLIHISYQKEVIREVLR